MDSKDNQFLESDDESDVIEENSRVFDNDPTLLVRAEKLKGSRPGDVRVRLVRPSSPAFRRMGAGLLEATKVTQAPRSTLERIKRLLIGAPIATAQAELERLTKFKALAVLSSDAIS